jgi:hypothetical protein
MRRPGQGEEGEEGEQAGRQARSGGPRGRPDQDRRASRCAPACLTACRPCGLAQCLAVG